MIGDYYILPPSKFRSGPLLQTQEKKTSYSSGQKVKPEIKGKNVVDKNKVVRTSISNIHKTLVKDKVRNPHITDTINKPADPFNREQFLKVWNAYIRLLDENGKKGIASIMQSLNPVVDGNLIHLTFSTQIMADELKKYQQGIIRYLSWELNNYRLEFNLVVKHDAENVTTKRLYSPQEILGHLYDKNSAIKDLMEKFSLRIG